MSEHDLEDDHNKFSGVSFWGQTKKSPSIGVATNSRGNQNHPLHNVRAVAHPCLQCSHHSQPVPLCAGSLGLIATTFHGVGIIAKDEKEGCLSPTHGAIGAQCAVTPVRNATTAGALVCRLSGPDLHHISWCCPHYEIHKGCLLSHIRFVNARCAKK